MSKAPSHRERVLVAAAILKKVMEGQRDEAIQEREKWEKITQAAKKKKLYFKYGVWVMFFWVPLVWLFLYLASKLYWPWEQPIFHAFSKWTNRILLRCNGVRIRKVINLNTEKAGQVLIVCSSDSGHAQIMHAVLPFKALMVLDHRFFKEYRRLGGEFVLKKARMLPVHTGIVANLYQDIQRFVNHVQAGYSLAFGIDRDAAYQGPAFLLKQISLPVIPVLIHLNQPIVFGNLFDPVDATVVFGKAIVPPENIRKAAKNRFPFTEWILEELDKLKATLDDDATTHKSEKI